MIPCRLYCHTALPKSVYINTHFCERSRGRKVHSAVTCVALGHRSMEPPSTAAVASPHRVPHKRRLLRGQGSASEPPCKSPARLFDDGADSRFRFDSDYVSKIGVIFAADNHLQYSSAPHPSPALGIHDMAKDTFDQGILEGMSCPRERRSSKDVLDHYFASRNSRSRRRSSAMETRQGLEAFLETENLKSSFEKLQEEANGETAATAKPPPSRKPISYSRVKDTRFSRSLSAEGYDPEDLRDRKQETQALLFDSTPDLSVEENYTRFPSIRCARRGAVCYDLQAPLVAFQGLCLEDK
ncbi:hypothetical protein CAPTEDRAFT_216866 [Capitella teleta]|uniref:Uncharacterized protein n=1 Tax=Capitella teleta TaxID=283909 RepID=R7TMF2_CAPTE|nr:hypothetical protein CAPTEDRAFT_216866 [Capitella teleta]|eukprot:ELT92736.1 hypothetical protein CAPTEDRAFT_216866 [Capitella teleta]